MKKYILTIVFPAFLLMGTGCGNTQSNQENEDSTTKTEEIELQKETESIDSLTIEIEKANDEIKESSAKLDELLENL